MNSLHDDAFAVEMSKSWLCEGERQHIDEMTGDWPVWPSCYCSELDSVTWAPSDYHPTVVERRWAAREFGRDGCRPLDLSPAEVANIEELTPLAKWLISAAPDDYSVPPRLNAIRLGGVE